MTALSQYERLESEGIWRESADAQRRNVVVSFGKATLVISDEHGKPLTHWSLPAVTRLNEGTRPALFTPEPDATETLEISEALMIDAIEKIRRTLLNARPRRGKFRWVLFAACIITLVALAVFWFPGAVRQQTLAVVPLSKRAEIDVAILRELEDRIGPSCHSTRGDAALNILSTRLLDPMTEASLVVFQHRIMTTEALPGGTIVIDRRLLESLDDPTTLAGYILAARARAKEVDPLSDVVDVGGLQDALRFLTTSELDPSLIRTYANAFPIRPNPATPKNHFLDLAKETKVDPRPYVTPQGGPSESPEFETKSVLDDNDWVSLQGICN